MSDNIKISQTQDVCEHCNTHPATHVEGVTLVCDVCGSQKERRDTTKLSKEQGTTCPRCGAKITVAPVKEWEFKKYHVKRFICANKVHTKPTDKGFMAFYKDGKFAYTVPKQKPAEACQ